MKKVRKKMTAVLLCCSLMVGGVVGSYDVASAASVGAGAAAESLQWLFSVLMGMGMTIDIASLFGYTKQESEVIDWDNWDWDVELDRPATQKEIEDTLTWVGDRYAEHVRNYQLPGSPSPTPIPDPTIIPPVTVPPINPDDVEPPLNWDELRNQTLGSGLLEMGAATYVCLKEAVEDLLIDIFYKDEILTPIHEDNKYKNMELVGYMRLDTSLKSTSGMYVPHTFNVSIYRDLSPASNLYFDKFNIYNLPSTNHETGYNYKCLNLGTQSSSGKTGIMSLYIMDNGIGLNKQVSNYTFTTGFVNDYYDVYHRFYLPYTLDGIQHEADSILLDKNALWPNPNLKNDYDNNNVPGFPVAIPPAIKLPTLDEIKDLMKQGSNDEDNRPVYVGDFIENHYVYPTPDPNPTESPDPVPDPDPDPDPDPNPDPDPSPDPDPDPNPDPDPSPDPTGIPVKPDEDINPDDYKTDLRLVFPFCIPFDLISLLKVLDAEPEAPVFEFPIDLELNNPWTGKKVIDYHNVFELDMGDFEPVVKIFRLFQVIFFIIGLMMITRQQMIKG